MQNATMPEDTSLQEAFYRAAKDAKEMKNLPITQLDIGRQFYIVKEFGHRALIDYGRLSTIYLQPIPKPKQCPAQANMSLLLKIEFHYHIFTMLLSKIRLRFLKRFQPQKSIAPKIR